MERVRVALEEHDCRVTGTGDQLAARCPAHDDGSPSLSLTSGDRRALLHCHAGCTTAEVLAALNLKDADLFDEPLPKGERATRQETHYEYRNADGQVVGRVTRRHPKKFVQSHPDGRGGWVWKASNDLKVTPYRLPELLVAISRGETVYVVEGEKDVHTLTSRGAVATCNAGGAGKWTEAHAKHLHGADVVVVRDNDNSGRSHSDVVMHTLAKVAASVRLVDVADGCKDVTDHLSAGHGLEDLREVKPAAKALAEPTPVVHQDTEPTKEDAPKLSQASALVKLARERYRLLVSDDGRPYAVKQAGPNVAFRLRGSGGLRPQLARSYAHTNNGAVPSQSALADALTVLEGYASDQDPEPVHLRVARLGDGVVIDLGTADGRCVVVEPGAWRREQRSPVLFRRTNATNPLPDPIRDGDGLGKLRALLNVDLERFRLLVGWLLAALIPNIPHPILALKGEQGTAKSKAAEFLLGLVDPSGAPLRTPPRDVKGWVTAASASWALCLDNVSNIPPWLSDTLCKAVTGDGFVDRALYTDDDVVVLSFRRVIALTTIDAGALAGDLAERLLIIELSIIHNDKRRSEEDVTTAYADDRAAILASLLDLLSKVLAKLPGIHLASMPRMADFTRVLAALDQVTGWTTEQSYLDLAANVSADVLEGDPFGQAVWNFGDAEKEWDGTTSQLLVLLATPDPTPKSWPKDATRAGGQLRRIAPVLRALGVNVTEGRTTDKKRTRIWTIQRTDSESRRNLASAASAASDDGQDQRKRPDATPDASPASASGSVRAATSADAADAATDAKGRLASGHLASSDQRKHHSSDAADAADAEMRPLSTSVAGIAGQEYGPSLENDEPPCCNGGSPVSACQLCPESGNYWRKAKAS